MAAATVNKINAALARHSIEVVKGAGYFYFAALTDEAQAVADRIPSVYSNVLRCMPLEDWIAHVEDNLKELRHAA